MVKMPKMFDIGLIKDIHFVWSELERVELDAIEAFTDSSKDLFKISFTMETLGFPDDSRFEAIRAFGMVQAVNLIAWITALRKEGITLKRFLREHRDFIKHYTNNEYVKRFIIEKNVDVFYP